MAEIIKMPKLSDAMEEGMIATWLKKLVTMSMQVTF